MLLRIQGLGPEGIEIVGGCGRGDVRAEFFDRPVNAWHRSSFPLFGALDYPWAASCWAMSCSGVMRATTSPMRSSAAASALGKRTQDLPMLRRLPLCL